MEKRRFILEFPLESFLTSPKEIISQDKSIRFVPNPDSNNLLDKAIVEIETGSEDRAEDEAYNILSRYLSILSYEYNCPMQISGPPSCHEIRPAGSGKTVGSVSQDLNALLVRRVDIDRLPDIAKYKSMQVALACYREARSSTNEFHQYLNYYRVVENLLKVKRKGDKKTAVVLHEKLNRAGVAVDGKPVDRCEAEEICENYRHALVHAGKERNLIRDRIGDLRRVRKGLPMIKHIARQCLEWKKRSLEASP